MKLSKNYTHIYIYMMSGVEDVFNSIDGYYEILGVDRNVDAKKLKSAYRKRSLKLHPDKGGDTRSFQCLNRAFVVLRYDISLHTQERHK